MSFPMSTNWIRVFVRISNFLRSLFRSSCETKKPSTNWFAPPVPVACSMQCNIWTLNREDYCQRCYKRNSKSNIFLIDYTIHLFIPFILKEKAESVRTRTEGFSLSNLQQLGCNSLQSYILDLCHMKKVWGGGRSTGHRPGHMTWTCDPNSKQYFGPTY